MTGAEGTEPVGEMQTREQLEQRVGIYLAPDKILSDVSIYSNHSFENIFKLIIG
jgi:hypothetical protein